jgi:spermidine/putrescine-binding protein
MNRSLAAYLKFLARVVRCLAVWLIASLLAGCAAQSAAPTPPPVSLARELTLYDWAESTPTDVLDAFTREYGVKINYVAYENQDDAVASIRAGQVYDVVALDISLIPAGVNAGLFAEIDYRHVPNFKNISANFRNLAYDPDNRYSVPRDWGTTGLLYRRDLVHGPITRWADLWDERYRGRVAIWEIAHDTLPIALKSLGYLANSSDPGELNAALRHLIDLKPHAILVPGDTPSVAPLLSSGQAVLAVGWAYDALASQEANPDIAYVLPEEGSILWSESYLIPANSPSRYTAEVFINFLLRPDISARLVNETFYANANEAARSLIDPALLNNPIVFPPEDALQNAEIVLPFSPTQQQIFDDIWQRFLDAGQ